MVEPAGHGAKPVIVKGAPGGPVVGNAEVGPLVPLNERPVGHRRILSRECRREQVHGGDEDLRARRRRGIDEAVDRRGIERALRRLGSAPRWPG